MKLEKRWTVEFTPDVVYEAWVSSATVIPPATRMEIDARVGGHYRLFIESDEFNTQNEGEFLLIEPGARVRYTWQWRGDDEITTIDVSFAATDNGTLIVLTHEGFLTTDSLETHDSGWDSYISGFLAHLSG